MTLVNYSYGARFARPRGTGGMGDVSPNPPSLDLFFIKGRLL